MLVYKFPQLSRKELEKMFTVSDFKETKFYQEVKEEGKAEGKIECILKLKELKLSAAKIAEILDLEVSVVREAIKNLKIDEN